MATLMEADWSRGQLSEQSVVCQKLCGKSDGMLTSDANGRHKLHAKRCNSSPNIRSDIPFHAGVCDLNKKFGHPSDNDQHSNDRDPQAAFGSRRYLADSQVTIPEIVTERSRNLLAKEVPFSLSEGDSDTVEYTYPTAKAR